MGIGPLNWIVSANTSGFAKSVLLARTEATAFKNAMREIRDPMDDWRAAEERLNTILQDARFTEEQRLALRQRLNAQNPETIRQTRELAEAERKLAEEMTRAQKLEAQAAQQRAAEREREIRSRMQAAAAVVQRNKTPEQLYADSVRELAALRKGGYFNGQEGAYRSELERLKGTLPAIQARRAAEQARQASEAEANQRHVEQLRKARQASEAEANQRHAGRLQEVRDREMAATKASADRATKIRELRDGIKGHNSAMSEYAVKIREINGLERTGLLTSSEASKARRKQTADMARDVPLIGGLLSGIIKNPVLAAGAMAGGAVLDQARRTWNRSDEEMNVLGDQGRSAKRLGMDPREYHLLAEAAEEFRLQNDAVESSLLNMRKTIGESSLGMGKAQKAYQELGLDASKLAQMKPSQAFEAINAALRAQQNPAERAALAMKIYGDEANNMLPMLMATSEQMAKIFAEKEKLGTIMTSEQLAMVAAAKAAKKDADEAEAGAARQLIGVRTDWEIWKAKARTDAAGIMKIVGQVLQSNRKQHDTGVADYEAANAAEAAAKTAAAEAAVTAETERRNAELERQQKAYEAAQKYVGDVNQKLREEAELLGMTADQVELMRLRWKGATDEEVRWVAMQQKRLGERREVLELAKTVEALNKSLADQVKYFGLQGAALELAKLQARGATEAQLANARAQQQRLNQLTEEQKLRDDAANINEQGKTPEARYREEVTRLQEMRDKDLIGLEAFAAAKKRAAEQLEKPIRVNVRVAGVEGAVKGTGAAFAAIDKARAEMAAAGAHKPNPAAEIDRQMAEERRRKQEAAARKEEERVQREQQAVIDAMDIDKQAELAGEEAERMKRREAERRRRADAAANDLMLRDPEPVQSDAAVTHLAAMAQTLLRIENGGVQVGVASP